MKFIKDETTCFWINPKILIILVAFLALAFLSYPAKAESGNITVTQNTEKDNYQFTIGTISFSNFSILVFDASDYNSISELDLSSGGKITYATNGKATSFSCVSNCTMPAGTSGSVTYSKIADLVVWYFPTGTTVSKSPMVLSYTSPILNDLSPAGGDPSHWFGDNNAADVDANHPVAVNCFQLGSYCGTPYNLPLVSADYPAGAVPFSYTAKVGTSATNNYNITYQITSQNLFTTNISKSAYTSVNTNLRIENASGSPVAYPVQGDANGNFNNNNWAVTNIYGQGIALNLSLSSGVKTITVINTTGSSITTPTPAPTAPPQGSNGFGITFDSSTHNVNDVGSIITNQSFGLLDFNIYRVDFYSNTNPLINQFNIDKSQTSQTFPVSFPSVGTYTANLVQHTLIGTDNIMATATTQAVQAQSYIFAPAEVTDGAKINITYQFNPAPTSGAIEDVILDTFGVPAYSNFINTTLCSCDTSQHVINYNINGVGNHLLRLWDSQNIKIVAQTKVIVDASGVVPAGNITSNYLALDNTQYSINDVINAQYQISSANWTKYSYFKAYLQSSGGVNMGAITLTSQTGTFQLPVSGGAFNIIQAGSAFVNMSAGNTSIDPNAIILASVPVTILANNNGYSVTTNPTTICLTQPEVVKYTAPFPGVTSAILQVEYMTPAGTTKFTNFSFTNNGTQQFVFNTGQVKDQSGIIFNILDSNNNFQVNSIIKYQSTGCTAPGTTPTPAATTPNPINDGTLAFNNFLSVLTMPALWGIFIFAAVIYKVASTEKSAHATPLVAFILANILAVLGFFAPFTWYILILTWIIAGIFFTIGRNTTTGVK